MADESRHLIDFRHPIDEYRGPIEVILTQRPSGYGVSCMVVDSDETTTTLDVDALSIRGAEREMTGWLIAQGWKPADRWRTEKEDENGADLEVSRRFTKAPEAKA
jgi:hypothetical protein